MYQPDKYPPTLIRPAPAAVGNSNALDHHYVFGGMTELADYARANIPASWKTHNFSAGGSGVDSHTFEDMLTKLNQGDIALGEASNALMEKFADLVPMSSAWSTRNDVVGSLPNVPAFLAGHPMSMRRRVRVAKEQAPLGVLVDITTSGGTSRDFMRKRGALVLALVRMLQSRRPITLYVTTGMAAGHPSNQTGQKSAVYITTKIETAPLDLARAGYIISSPDWRYWSFGISHLVGWQPQGAASGKWPYSNHDITRRHAREIFAGVIPGAEEVFFVGSSHVSDADTDNPEKWLRAMLGKYGDAHAEAA